MSAKPIREFDGKHLLAYWLPRLSHPSQGIGATTGSATSPATSNGEHSVKSNGKASLPSPTATSPTNPAATFLAPNRMVHLAFDTSLLVNEQQFQNHVLEVFDIAEKENPWVLSQKLVCKPDQLIKRRGKNGLLGINLDWAGVKEWISKRAGKPFKLEKTEGLLHTFLVEPLCIHPQDSEYYVAINSVREGDWILFTHEGGVDVGDVDAKARKFLVQVDQPFPEPSVIEKALLFDVKSATQKATLVEFITRLYAVYSELQFTYLEINPLVVLDSPNGTGPAQVFYLDLAAKLDQTAEFECGKYWAMARKNAYRTTVSGPSHGPAMEFPAPFGRELTKEEAYIADLDAKTGASLKLTVLNPTGRIWTMVAGGGASVVYSDAIAALGYAHELANYGEYSGAPSESQTYEYGKTILDLMTRGNPHPEGKFLFIGGGIANFTNVAATFKGIIRAMKEYQRPLQEHHVRVFVRRAGPNYQEGLRMMRNLGENLGVEINVFGPEMHVTGIVPLALKGGDVAKALNGHANASTGLLDGAQPSSGAQATNDPSHGAQTVQEDTTLPAGVVPFTSRTRAFIYGMQPRAVQGMLDFDFMCNRKEPSVACMIYPFGGHHVQKFYWGTKEMLIPVYTTVQEAVDRFPGVDVVVNFASCRSVYESTTQLLSFPAIRTIAIIAEGVPEKRARALLHEATQRNVLLIGPATVGGIKPGCFKIGNTGGMMDNIVSSKLYRPGSVAYVSKSGGMSNELNNIVSRATDGVYEGVAIGGDRYPGSTFIDHMLRYEKDPNAKILVLLGEVGGVEEYHIARAVKEGRITKPVVAWCIGTCAKMFTTDVQFGHAGSFANSDVETAEAKNRALKAAGVIVPDTFEDLPAALEEVYRKLTSNKTIVPRAEPPVPKIPIDYSWAQELGLIRKPASFISTICDDRGQELLYAGMAISEVFKEDIGIGGVLSLLWFKRRLPSYAAKFIEMVLMLTADHGPAVSGAHNTIVTARAGKDLISSLVAGLLTIGDRFGGALDGAARDFSTAYDSNLAPSEFVTAKRKANQLILGIGHKIKSRTNPDLRVEIVKDFVLNNFPNTEIFRYALEVEKFTTAKKDNLILNVDGAVGVAFVDLLRGCGAFSREEAEEYIKIGTLNGLFVLGRSIGFIGHYLDQKRLKQGLYRHPWDDISYLTPETSGFGSHERTLAEGSVVMERGAQRN
ncbi:citrate synthase-like protein [Fimicolochytrium jonesii]|uniref:citrate synthase-like protein n=1 Tax=Fimicolochytrium jonesii TaxID=1396493 RepID=UPI0022FE1906|nr:citrate synthase-like protein [Fimicolochytrium jonesii]KAI8818369.1 citrate synthase-like protein [Fimicolochytrium jonesii]